MYQLENLILTKLDILKIVSIKSNEWSQTQTLVISHSVCEIRYYWGLCFLTDSKIRVHYYEIFVDLYSEIHYIANSLYTLWDPLHW